MYHLILLVILVNIPMPANELVEQIGLLKWIADRLDPTAPLTKYFYSALAFLFASAIFVAFGNLQGILQVCVVIFLLAWAGYATDRMIRSTDIYWRILGKILGTSGIIAVLGFAGISSAIAMGLWPVETARKAPSPGLPINSTSAETPPPPMTSGSLSPAVNSSSGNFHIQYGEPNNVSHDIIIGPSSNNEFCRLDPTLCSLRGGDDDFVTMAAPGVSYGATEAGEPIDGSHTIHMGVSENSKFHCTQDRSGEVDCRFIPDSGAIEASSIESNGETHATDKPLVANTGHSLISKFANLVLTVAQPGT